MAKPKKAAPRKKNAELPGITGTGVSAVQILEIDNLAADYVKERDKRLKQTPREVSAKGKLSDAMHRHADELRQPDGTLVYRYDDSKITVEPGKEKLRVQSLDSTVEVE